MSGIVRALAHPAALRPVDDRDRAYALDYDPGAPFFRGHYPHFPIVPGVFLVEAAARAATAAAGDESLVLGRVDRARFLRPVQPGETVTYVVDRLERRESGWSAKVVALVGDDRAATVTMSLTDTDPDLGPCGAAGPEPDRVAPIDLLTVLPHRHPMLCVDAVSGIDDEQVVARTVVGANSLGLWGRPTTEALPTVLVIESWCQAAGVLAARSRDWATAPAGEVMLFGGLSSIEVGAPALPGQTLVHHARFSFQGPGITLMEGWSEVAGRTALRVESVTLAVRPASELSRVEPEEMSVVS